MYKQLSRPCQQVSRMTTQEKLIAALMAAFPGESETAIARRCGLSIGRFSNYKLGKRVMDVDAVIGCAQALGWDVRATVAQHEIETSPSPRVKAMWRKLAAATALLLVGVLGSAQQPVQAAEIGAEADPIHIMRNNLLWWGRLLRDWLAHKLHRPKPSPNNVEASVAWI